MLLRFARVLAPLGFLEYWPGQVGFSRDGGHSLTGFLSAQLGLELRGAVYTSEPRANRKPVLQLIDRHGQTIGYAKVGVNELSNHLVQAEVQALQELNAAHLQQVIVPRLLFGGDWNGHAVLVQTALPGVAAPGPIRLAPAMLELAECGGRQQVDPRSNAYVDRLAQRMTALGTDRGQALVAMLSAITRQSVDPLALGAWHGDWTPWNMAVNDGRVVVWDWERYERCVPIGYDALHYDLQAGIARQGLSPQCAARNIIEKAPQLLESFAVSPSQARIVAMFYLLEIGTRYDSDGQYLTGSRLGDLDAWLMPVLREALALDRAE